MEGKTVQQGLDGPNYNKTISGDCNDDGLGGNRKKKEAKTLVMTSQTSN